MAHAAEIPAAPVSIRAVTVSRDVRGFDLLVEDMEALVGPDWGDLTWAEALLFLDQPEAAALEFLVLALDLSDEAALPAIAEVTRTAAARGLRVLVVADGVGPAALHRLLSLGAQAFLPYPLPQDALAEALRAPPSAPAEPPRPPAVPPVAGGGDGRRNGVILPVQGLAGGVGATTFAVTLATELARLRGDSPPRVGLLDLDLQGGAVATYLDLTQHEAVIELLQEGSALEVDVLEQAMLPHGPNLRVLAAPPDILPLDLLRPADVDRLIDLAASIFDYVVIDMPSTVVQWTETVLRRAHLYFALLQMDMRSARNALRLLRALRAEELPVERLRLAVNRAPGRFDFSGQGRLRKLSETLGAPIALRLPDGGRAVAEACDAGLPLAAAAARNPLRRAIAGLAPSVAAPTRAAGER